MIQHREKLPNNLMETPLPKKDKNNFIFLISGILYSRNESFRPITYQGNPENLMYNINNETYQKHYKEIKKLKITDINSILQEKEDGTTPRIKSFQEISKSTELQHTPEWYIQMIQPLTKNHIADTKKVNINKKFNHNSGRQIHRRMQKKRVCHSLCRWIPKKGQSRMRHSKSR